MDSVTSMADIPIGLKYLRLKGNIKNPAKEITLPGFSVIMKQPSFILLILTALIFTPGHQDQPQ